MDAEASGPDLRLEIRLDGQRVFQGTVLESQKISISVNDDEEKEHLLEIEMQGKTSQHTRIDPQGNILEDRVIKLSNITFDEVKLGHLFTELSEYRHDRNGTGTAVVEKFYGEMGCNGIISMRFTTPIYLWLLEHL